MEPLSGWIDYPLESTMLDPPLLRLRLRPIDTYDVTDNSFTDGELRAGRAIVQTAVQAVAEWDLVEGGKPIPVTEETKLAFLRPILGEPLLGSEGKLLLGIKIVRDARNRENFLKN
jgi:hypothetical protein